MKTFYVTYGFNSNLGKKYSKVRASTATLARELVMDVTKGKFAFMYPEEEFLPQIEKYGLQEVALQPQELYE